MPHKHELQRCAADDPNRCQGPGHKQEGQCIFRATGESDYCPRHGGQMAAAAEVKASYKGYLLDRWMQRSKSFDDSGDLKSLRAEIGILKMMLEQVLSTCKNETDILLQTNVIGDLIGRIQSLVRDATKLEASLGLVMDQQQAIQFVDRILEIIEEHVVPDTLATISSAVGKLIEGHAQDAVT